MKVTQFDPSGDLVIVTARVWGASGDHRDVQVAVDTGATMTIIIPEVTDAMGYSARGGHPDQDPLGRR